LQLRATPLEAGGSISAILIFLIQESKLINRKESHVERPQQWNEKGEKVRGWLASLSVSVSRLSWKWMKDTDLLQATL